ncbi:MAG: hypothetical protein ACI8P2_000027 [Candidatus Latescibacterota bacterium]
MISFKINKIYTVNALGKRTRSALTSIYLSPKLFIFNYIVFKNLTVILRSFTLSMDENTVVETPSAVIAAPLGASEDTIRSPLVGDVETSIRKEGISYIFESRSVSAVLNFIYTPIDGTFADIELEINNADPIKPAEDGGLLVDMGGRVHAADSEEVERHFISCEQLDDCVEARWQWVVDEEQANFLYRFRIIGKSLVVEVEGGNGKASGLSLGRVTGALHPKLITIPYFNFGENYPRLLCTSGVFLSSFIDWQYTNSSELSSVDEATAQGELRLNGGCNYRPRTDDKRHPLQDRWIFTASTQFEEAFPNIAMPAAGREETQTDKAWYNIPHIEATEESYVELYESFRILKQLGINELFINHPAEIWHDGDGDSTFKLDAATAKGGDDAFSEYLDALTDLGYKAGLQVNFRDIAAVHADWDPTIGAQSPDGNPIVTGTGQYLVKPTWALERSAQHTADLIDKYHPEQPYVASHAALAPWDFNDCDAQIDQSSTLRHNIETQRALLTSQRESGAIIGDGGNHWFYAGILNGYLARMAGTNPSEIPAVVDFALKKLHPLQSDAGVGTIDQYFGGTISQSEKHSRSISLSRYLAATVAFGHAVLLPDLLEWGLPSVVKAYFMLQKLQSQYLRVPVDTIHYHHNGNLLDTNDALLSGAFELGQLQITYSNGTLIYANLGSESWDVEVDTATYTLPQGGFVARGCAENLLVYSAETESGRIDYASCDEYTYIDVHGQAIEGGPITLDGAALVKERKWEIDVVPMDCKQSPTIDVAHYWPGRKLPPLRLLAYSMDEETPKVYRADMEGSKVKLPQIESAYMYRITLPEWMVEPGQ